MAGYQPPANPAPVSGPGALSQRTDGGPSQPRMQLPDAGYGEQADFQAIQAGAPMAEDPGAPMPPGLDAPTMRPYEPVTAGVPVGPGANSLIAPKSVTQSDNQKIAKYLPQFEQMARLEDTPESFRLFVRYLKGAS